MSIKELAKTMFIDHTINSVRQAEKFLRRDFHELENLKSEGNKLDLFARRARDRSAQLMYNFLSKYYKNLFLIDDANFNNQCSFSEAAVFEPLTDLANFSHNLPFFASVAGIMKKDSSGQMQPAAIAVYFPIIGVIAYNLVGETSKIEVISGSIPGIRNARVSGNSKAASAMVAFDKIEAKDLDILQSHDIKNDRLLSLGSPYYALLLLVTGKVDIIKADFGTNHAAKLAAMLVDNAGGYSKIVGTYLHAACAEELMI